MPILKSNKNKKKKMIKKEINGVLTPEILADLKSASPALGLEKTSALIGQEGIIVSMAIAILDSAAIAEEIKNNSKLSWMAGQKFNIKGSLALDTGKGTVAVYLNASLLAMLVQAGIVKFYKGVQFSYVGDVLRFGNSDVRIIPTTVEEVVDEDDDSPF